jgi:hypothetical protein
MKKIFFLAMLGIGLAGCETYDRVPYSGTMGNYGFTYDLDASPSPFVDTSYRPLTPYDLMAPIIITVTNQPQPQVIHREPPSIGETLYSGETPARTAIIAPSAEIREAAGVQRPTTQAAPGTGPVAPRTAAPGTTYFSAPDVEVFTPTNGFPDGTNINNISTNGNPINNIPTNDVPTNEIPTNLVPNPQTQTNPAVSPGGDTNRILLEPTVQPSVTPAPPALQPQGVQTPGSTSPALQSPAPTDPRNQPLQRQQPEVQPTPTPPPAPGSRPLE